MCTHICVCVHRWAHENVEVSVFVKDITYSLSKLRDSIIPKWQWCLSNVCPMKDSGQLESKEETPLFLPQSLNGPGLSSNRKVNEKVRWKSQWPSPRCGLQNYSTGEMQKGEDQQKAIVK